MANGKKQQDPALEYVSEWDSEESAAEFFRDYEKVLKGKWKHCDIAISKDLMMAGTGDAGYFVTRRMGALVSSVEGLQEESDWNALKAVPPAQSAVRISFLPKVPTSLFTLH